MTIGERLKFVRGEMMQEDLANRLDVHKNTLAGYERGKSQPDAAYLQRFLNLFKDVSPAWLLAEEGPMKRGGIVAEAPPQWHCERPHLGNADPELAEIVEILQRDLPEAKPFVLKVLRGKKDVKEGLEGLGIVVKEGE